MYSYTFIARRYSFILVLSLVLVLALTACGVNSTTTGSSSTASPSAVPSPTATKVLTVASTTGCPGSTLTTLPSAATLVLTNANTTGTVNAKNGETIEVDLPVGHTWQGPSISPQNLLAMQSPSGYTSTKGQFCVWRFVASGVGTVHLSFTGRPICKKGQLCPMYVMAIPFTINVR
jgi:hypothetical protein